jgi:hypothetical protein
LAEGAPDAATPLDGDGGRIAHRPWPNDN